MASRSRLGVLGLIITINTDTVGPNGIQRNNKEIGIFLSLQPVYFS